MYNLECFNNDYIIICGQLLNFVLINNFNNKMIADIFSGIEYNYLNLTFYNTIKLYYF